MRRGTIPSRKPLLQHTCMDLYHTTSGARMKQLDRPALPHTIQIWPSSKWLLCLIPFLGRVWAQPQRDVLRLHRLPHDRYQFCIQTVQVRLVA